MKKTLIVIFSLVVLLGVGFMYLVKNPGLPIAQKVLSTVGMDKKINITNCINYFDGCNTCSVKDGQIDICTLMACQKPEQAKCLAYIDTGATGSGAIENSPAASKCKADGGEVKIVQGVGSELIDFCQLSKKTTCEMGAYMSGTCGNSLQKTGTTVSQTGKNITTKDPLPSTTNKTSLTTQKGAIQNKIVCTMDYVPVCANIQVICTNKKEQCPVIAQTFGNKCMMNSNPAARFLYEGECKAK